MSATTTFTHTVAPRYSKAYSAECSVLQTTFAAFITMMGSIVLELNRKRLSWDELRFGLLCTMFVCMSTLFIMTKLNIGLDIIGIPASQLPFLLKAMAGGVPLTIALGECYMK